MKRKEKRTYPTDNVAVGKTNGTSEGAAEGASLGAPLGAAGGAAEGLKLKLVRLN